MHTSLVFETLSAFGNISVSEGRESNRRQEERREGTGRISKRQEDFIIVKYSNRSPLQLVLVGPFKWHGWPIPGE